MGRVHFGDHLRRLAPSTIEAALNGTDVYTKKDRGWSPDAKHHGLFVDLSRVEWVDSAAVVQVVVLIEDALRHGISVSVAWPLGRARRSESEWLQAEDSISRPLRARILGRASGSLQDISRFRGKPLLGKALHVVPGMT